VAAGVGRENGGRRKKEDMRRNDDERGRRPMYNTRAPGRLAPFLVRPGARCKGASPNGTL
jgi:hypothetical protein